MWEQIRGLFFGQETHLTKVQPLDVRDGILIFRASKSLRVAEQVKVLVPTAGDDTELLIEVSSFDPSEHVYSGTMLGPIPDSILFERRAQFRLNCQLEVTSPDDPEFEAVAEDLSLSGARLNSNKELSPGHRLSLTLGFGPQVELQLPVEVRWCARSGVRFRLGVHFMQDEQQRASLWRQFENLIGP
jgi:hypothetical protein